MIVIDEAKFENLIVHRIGNQEHESVLGDKTIGCTDDQFILIKRVLLKPFMTHAYTFEFTHEVDLANNVLFQLAKSIRDGGDFMVDSQKIAQHLIAMSKDADTKEGDLFIATFNDVKFNGSAYRALGIYKFEDKESYMETTVGDDNELHFAIRKGLNSKKPDKAVLVLFTEDPFTLFVIDNNKGEADVWGQDFIKYQAKEDFVNHTTDFLTMTNEFIKDRFPQEYEVDKIDQIDLMNRSADYFKNHDVFNKDEFEQNVLGSEELVTSFNNFDEQYRDQNDLTMEDTFKIADQAVKKQNKNFKGIVKLDKNFHIYIHGGRDQIEKGEEEDGRKYYKLYYDEES